MYGAVCGLKILREKFGNFEINDRMIFITPKGGKIKVWHNKNLAKNEP